MKLQAINLRNNGLSCREISKALAVPLSTIKRWVKNIKLSSSQKAEMMKRRQNGASKGAMTRRQLAKKRQQKYVEQGRIDAAKKDWQHVAGCMLWWCEGTKSQWQISLANCDPSLLQFFVKFLKQYYDVLNADFSIAVQYHANKLDQGVEKDIELYWVKTLDLTGCKVNRFTIKPVKSSKTKHKYGVCTVRVYKTSVVRRIKASIEAYVADFLFSIPALVS